MLVHRPRWPNITTPLDQCLLFSGLVRRKPASHLSWKRSAVDGVLRAQRVLVTEVDDDFADSVLVGERTSGYVDIMLTLLVQDQLHGVSRVHQCPAHLDQQKNTVNPQP